MKEKADRVMRLTVIKAKTIRNHDKKDIESNALVTVAGTLCWK